MLITSSRIAGAALLLLGALSCNGKELLVEPVTPVTPVSPPPPPAAEAPPPGPTRHGGSDCHNRPIAGGEIMAKITPAVVRLKTDLGSGTGFVIATPREDELVIATNHHVIKEGHKFSAVISTSSGSFELADLKVVKLDSKNDLALLRTSRPPGVHKGLYLNEDGVKTSQEVAAVGYPYLPDADRFELTFSKGYVSAAEVPIENRKGITVDLKLNRGNSGGPVVDACGFVVGVVVQRLSGVQRENLVVPVNELIGLYKRYTAPRPPPQEAVREQLAKFEMAEKFRQGDEAAALFTESFLESEVLEDLEKTLAKVELKMPSYRAQLVDLGVPADAPLAVWFPELLTRIPAYERGALMTYVILENKLAGPHEALKYYLSTWIADIFGDIQQIKLVDVTDASETAATARVEITNERGTSYWIVQFAMEAGDYRIKSLKPVRVR